MASKLYVRDGGIEAANQVDINDMAPYFEGTTPLIELGMSFQNGGASQGSFVTAPTDVYGTPGGIMGPHAQVTWTEDASGDELWLARGRTSGEEEGRGIALAEDIVEHVVTVDDGNVDLRGLAFTEDWVRPAETDTDRLYALDAYILSGASSTSPTLRFSTDITISDAHLAPDSNTVDMPAKTYAAGTQPPEVIGECSTASGKVYGVVIHHIGGSSHLCLEYILESDHSTYASTVKVSDQIANWDPDDLTAPVLQPIWDQGKGLVFGGQAAISGLVSRYGPTDQFIYVNNTTREDQYEHWIDSYSDSDAQNLTEATARATAILNYRAPGDFTYRFSLLMLAEQIHLIAAGMSIQVDTAVVLGGTYRGSYEDVRIVGLSWEPVPDGRYFAHLQLNRALRNGPASQGKGQAAATTPKPAPECLPDTVVAPTTLFHWTFTSDELDDESSTYSIGLERTVPGGFGSSYGDSIGMDADGPYGHNDAGHYASVSIPVTAGNDYSFRADVAWHYDPSSRNVDVRWYDTHDVRIGTDRLISGSGRSVGVRYEGLGATYTAPVGADHMQIYWTNFAGLYADNVYWETPGSIVAADNAEFCVNDSGDSPYYARSDDPRFTELANGVTDATTGFTAFEHLLHGGFIRAAHADATTDDSVANRPYLFSSTDGVTFTAMDDAMMFDFGASSRDPSILHWDNQYWVAHTGPSDLEKFTVWNSAQLAGGGWDQIAQPSCSAISPGPFRVWAPEWFVDPDGDGIGAVHIFLAASYTGFTDFQLYEIHPTNRTMTTWSAPVIVTGTSLPVNMIDPCMVKKDGLYQLWYKQENTGLIEYMTSSSLTSGYTVTETGDWAGWSTNEGPNIVKIDDGRWRIYMVDNAGFGTVDVLYSDSVDDWATWSTLTPIVTPFLTSHGTTIRIPSVIDLATSSSVGSLDDLSDVVLATPAEGDMLRHDGTKWVNTPGRWEPVTTPGQVFVWDGDEIVMGWNGV